MEQAEKATFTSAELEVYLVPAPEGNGEEMEVGESDNAGGLEVNIFLVYNVLSLSLSLSL